jgi:hypothetical protein
VRPSGCEIKEKKMGVDTQVSLDRLLENIWFDLEGQPFLDLTKGKTLQGVVAKPRVCFVLGGPEVELDALIEEASLARMRHDALAVVVSLGRDDIDGVDRACSWDDEKPRTWPVPVLDLDRNEIGNVRISSVGGTENPNEHGYLPWFTTVARVIHKNDLFMVSETNEEGLPLVYRALAEYDRRKDRVLFERTTPGIDQPAKQYMELPPNQLVFVSWGELDEVKTLEQLLDERR